MSDPDLSQFRLVPKGNGFERFSPGQRFDHHWGRTFCAGDNALFTTATHGAVPLYVNAEYARAHGHPDTVVNPLLVLCTAVGLSVEDLSEAGGPFLGVNDVSFLQPVYAGDTLTASSEVVSARGGVVFVDGARLSEPYVDPSRRGNESRSWPRVPSGHYFVLGDNRNHSCDSRAWGTVPRSSLIGPVMLSYWPPTRLSLR